MIKDFKPGDKFVSFFVLRKKEIKAKRESNEIYLALELGDASGRISGTLWENVREKFDEVTHGDIIKVKAQVINFKDRLHLNIEKLRKGKESDDFDLKQLVPVVDKDINTLYSHLDALIESVRDPFLSNLLQVIFEDKEIRRDFGNAPGGKLWHHNYLGGLMEHTLSVTDIAHQVGQMYPGINRDLLITAALLHDIGKIEAYKFKTLIDFTDEGRLVGHIVIGAKMVAEKIKKIKGFPRELETKLIHLILSHQGKLEQASPVVPMMLEGLILYYADELDSKANAFLRIKKKESGKKWSSYVKLLNQYFFLDTEGEQPEKTF